MLRAIVGFIVLVVAVYLLLGLIAAAVYIGWRRRHRHRCNPPAVGTVWVCPDCGQPWGSRR